MKKKHVWNMALILVAVAACLAAATLGDDLDRRATSPVALTTDVSPVTSYRERRDTARAQMTDSLKTLLTSELSDEGARAAAQQQLIALVERAEQELALEAAAAGMGVECACAVREGVTVIAVDAPLDSAQVGGLVSLAVDITGISANGVRVLQGGR